MGEQQVMVKSAILKKHFEIFDFDDNFFDTYENKASDKLKNIDELCDALHDIQQSGRKIVIYTDFDVDGIMSSVIAYAGLSELGFNVGLQKPLPSNGYGFRCSDVDSILNIFPDASVILTGDVGIANNDAIDYAKSKGLTVFVTDHHTVASVCNADIAVNPNQLGESYSQKGICGSFILYKVMMLYAFKYGHSNQIDAISELKMFAGIATISDSMPLLFENRQLVRDSISIMRRLYELSLGEIETGMRYHSENYIRAFMGTKKLLDFFTGARKLKKAFDIDEQFYGFYLVPFLNSCKRTDGDMDGIYDIFFCPYIDALDDIPNMSCVVNAIAYIDRLNEYRKERTAYYFEKLMEEQGSGSEIADYMESNVYITNAPAGFLGLLGSKFIAMTGLPTLVVNANEDGSYSGSGRNPSWFDFADALQKHNIPITCSGHKEAFGVFIPDKATLDAYVTFFVEVVITRYIFLVETGKIKSTAISVSYNGCTECNFDFDNVLVDDFLGEMNLYHPFGTAFPAPCFDFYVKLSDVKEKMFGNAAQHMKLITEDGLEILLFNMALDFEMLKAKHRGEDITLICSGTFNYDTYIDPDSKKINFLANGIIVAT